MSLAAEIHRELLDGRLRKREALYALACAQVASEARTALLDLLVLIERQEQGRVREAQAVIDLSNTERAA